jgi:hypothetical protein
MNWTQDGAREPPALTTGRYVHRAIARLLQTGVRSPTFEDCDRALAREFEVRGEFARPAWAIHRRACGAVLTYFTRFGPPPASRLTGVEVPLGQVRLDLVWSTRDGRSFADEIKLGTYSSLRPTDSLVVQLRAQGSAFFEHDRAAVGIRLLPLRCPRRALWLDRSYTLRPLTSQESR